MPCQSEYLEPSPGERECRNMCELIVFVSQNSYQFIAPDWAIKGAESCYGASGKLHEATRLLCKWCKMLPEEFIYNGRKRGCRNLANWWEKHQEHDRKREAKELHNRRQGELKKQALAKLTKEEIEALGYDE